jgi:UDP-N-acetylmuramate: L-alanyl-gamma-D-glutamyl-meso-diaminopimelate ligase
MELRGEVGGISVYDDFAHHPTAIQTTLDGLRQQVGDGRIIAMLEPRSNTMKRDIHTQRLSSALDDADQILLFAPDDLQWDAVSVMAPMGPRAEVFHTTQGMIDRVIETARPGDHVLIMSNGGFEAIHQRLLDALQYRL